MSITKPQAEIIADMVPQWEKAMDEIVDALTPCAADFCRHESREHKDSCGCLHPGCECDTFIAPSTPAPQGEIPDIEVMRKLAGDNWEPYLINRINEAESTLARERESRKQAEAALRDVKSLVDSQITYLQALAKNNDLSDHGTGKLAAFMNMRDALSKPVQEPAERERGK